MLAVLMPRYVLAMFTTKSLPKRHFTFPSTYLKTSPVLDQVRKKEKAEALVSLEAQKRAEEREADLVRNKAIDLHESFTPFVSEKLLRQKVDELIQTKKINLKENQFYLFSTSAKEGAIVDGDTLRLSQVMKNMIGDIADESTRKLNFSERQIQLSADYSGEIIKTGFDLLKKYTEKKSILDDVAALDLKKFTEVVKFYDYLGLEEQKDVYTIVANELVDRIIKASSNAAMAQSEVQELNKINRDFLSQFVFDKARWRGRLMSLLAGRVGFLRETPFFGNPWAICLLNNKNLSEDAKKIEFFLIDTDKNGRLYSSIRGVIGPRKLPIFSTFSTISDSSGGIQMGIEQADKPFQVQYNCNKKITVAAAKGNLNNGIVLDFGQKVTFALPQCSSAINSITINHQATHVAASFDTGENNLIVWDITEARQGVDKIKIDPQTCPFPVSNVVFARNADDVDILICSSKNFIYSKNIDESKWHELTSFENDIERVEVCSDGKTLIVTSLSRIVLINADTGNHLCKYSKNVSDNTIMPSPDGTYFVPLKNHDKNEQYLKFSENILWIYSPDKHHIAIKALGDESEEKWANASDMNTIIEQFHAILSTGNNRETILPKALGNNFTYYWNILKKFGSNAAETLGAYIRTQQ